MKQIIELTDKTYSQFMQDNDTVLFIDFYSPTCGPCRTLMSFLPRILDHYDEKDLTVIKIDVSTNPKIAKKFEVRSVPVALVVGKDKMVKEGQAGLQEVHQYFKMIDRELDAGKGFFKGLFSKK